MQKRFPKSDPHVFQKGPQKRATIIKMDSKSDPKMGFQKTLKNDDFQPSQMWLKCCKKQSKSMNFNFWFWPPFGFHFGGVLGAQMEAKAIKKPFQKNVKQMMPKMSPNWSQNGAKIVKSEVLEAPCFQGGSQVASRAPPGSILERVWDHVGAIFGSCSDICLYAFFSSMLQTKTFKIKRGHQKNAAETFQEPASLFVPSCIEHFSSDLQ